MNSEDITGNLIQIKTNKTPRYSTFPEKSLSNDNNNSISFKELTELYSYDYREVRSFIPKGITSTAHGLRIRESKRLSSVRLWSVMKPAKDESVIISLYRARGNPFSYTNMIKSFELNRTTFPGAAIELDISDHIISGITLEPSDYIICTLQHSGIQQIQPLNINWNTSIEPWSKISKIAKISKIMWPPTS